MNIIYDDSNKSVRCWKDFIENPSGREEIRSFKKTFGQNLINKAVRLHEKMLGHESVGTYNKEYKTDNQIELVKGGKDNEEQRFKVRVDLGYRKFFCKVNKDGKCLLKKDWDGDFYDIDTIFVTDVNNHDYKRK